VSCVLFHPHLEAGWRGRCWPLLRVLCPVPFATAVQDRGSRIGPVLKSQGEPPPPKRGAGHPPILLESAPARAMVPNPPDSRGIAGRTAAAQLQIQGWCAARRASADRAEVSSKRPCASPPAAVATPLAVAHEPAVVSGHSGGGLGPHRWLAPPIPFGCRPRSIVINDQAQRLPRSDGGHVAGARFARSRRQTSRPFQPRRGIARLWASLGCRDCPCLEAPQQHPWQGRAIALGFVAEGKAAWFSMLEGLRHRDSPNGCLSWGSTQQSCRRCWRFFLEGSRDRLTIGPAARAGGTWRIVVSRPAADWTSVGLGQGGVAWPGGMACRAVAESPGRGQGASAR